MGKFLIFCWIQLKFPFWLHKNGWHTAWKFQLEIRSIKKVIAKNLWQTYMKQTVASLCCIPVVHVTELPSLLPIKEVAEALMYVPNGAWLLCRMVANSPDSFREGKLALNFLNIHLQSKLYILKYIHLLIDMIEIVNSTCIVWSYDATTNIAFSLFFFCHLYVYVCFFLIRM